MAKFVSETRRMRTTLLLPIVVIASTLSLQANTEIPIPEQPLQVLEDYCLDCHDEFEQKGDINLERLAINWADKGERHLWESVHHMASEGMMPPSDERQPSPKEREALLAWLDSSLLEHTPIGGTLPRRLSAEEYQSTIRHLFDLPDYKLPLGFPKDSEYHGFNNVGKGLVLSPPLMEAYANVAEEIANTIYPPKRTTPTSTTRTAGPNDMVLSFSAGKVVDDALLLVSRGHEIFRSCSWPSRMEIMSSGTYRITVSAAKHKPTWGGQMKLEIRARELTASDRSRADIFRLLKVMDVPSTEPTKITFEADLYEGQTLLFRWMNADMAHDYSKFAKQMREWFERDTRWLAAWQRTVFPNGDFSEIRGSVIRGRSGWEYLSKALADPGLDMSRATMDDPLTVKFLEMADSNHGMFNYADILCHYYFTNGPAMEFHEATIEGPLKLVDGPREMLAKELQQRFTGTRQPKQSEIAFARETLEAFLPKAFRRPVDEQTIDTYLGIAERHLATGNSLDATMHLLVRNILISPRFIYRQTSPGELDEYNLANRLSYFLTQAPPDQQLLELAHSGKLSDPKTLREQAIRLMPRKPTSAMVQSFTGQWLDTNLLPEIMPDPKFKFSEAEIALAEKEVEHFFTEILTKNLPMTDFIDPDFHYTTPQFARNNYQYSYLSQKNNSVSNILLQFNLEDFHQEIEPILEKTCYSCHGPDEQKGDFRIDKLNPNLAEGGDDILWLDVMDMVANGKMPPTQANVSITDKERGLIVDWIAPIDLSKGSDYERSRSDIQKLPLDRGSRFGGLLAQSAIMTATANGVDTQPGLRGVWMLENILGMPPPDPPKDVPALTPDTRGATTPRDLLSKHTSDKACYSCHQNIDPVGFVFENFDPVGNWRDEWPKIDTRIDPSGTLPDGTPIKDITDFKAWLVDNIDHFSQCLSEKLMTYATGRVPNYSERKEIEAIVEANHEHGNGFQDLLLGLIASDTFRAN